ncbi:MAG: GDP-mannose-dependent alpha-(1-6)-phosphatidylinositol monomannoside mannosyltransferase, partial [Planctomycetota bacterium]
VALNTPIAFLGSRPDVDRLLPALDVFTLTSKMEASPVSILEAAACGIPVVATNVGSIGETILPRQNGYLVPVDDVDAIVAAWRELAADREHRQAMGKTGRNQVVQRASLDVMVDGYQELIQRIYDRKCGGTGPIRQSSTNPEMAMPVPEEVA